MSPVLHWISQLPEDFWWVTLGTFVVQELAFLIFNGFYMMVDEMNLFPRYKLQKDRKLKHEVIWSTFTALVRGHIFELLPILMLAWPLLNFCNFSWTAPFPSFKTFALQFIICNVLEDAGFYWVHRLMHRPWFYKNIHSRHHEYICSIDSTFALSYFSCTFLAPFSLAGSIFHPAEFFLGILVPLMAGPVTLGYFQGIHLVTFCRLLCLKLCRTWMVFREMRGSDAHSGYHLPYHPLRLIDSIYGGPLHHDFHHQLQGRNCNFGGYKMWDWLMGTDKPFYASKYYSEWSKGQRTAGRAA